MWLLLRLSRHGPIHYVPDFKQRNHYFCCDCCKNLHWQNGNLLILLAGIVWFHDSDYVKIVIQHAYKSWTDSN